jgi:hypothetical protein
VEVIMNKLIKGFYSLAFQNKFLEKNGNQFQDFFADIMEKRYPADFIRTRPWGRSGDKKNDGYLKSKRTLFQVYAPDELKEKNAIKKIDDDFNSALPYWDQYFDSWVFVHNSKKGVGPGILRKLLELEKGNTSIKITSWGFEELKKEFLLLTETDMEDLCGRAPSDEDMEDITFKEISAVITTISRQKYPDGPIKPVSKTKLKFNSLSDDVENLLLAGMKKSQLVKKYFDECSDPNLGDEIAEVFNKKYLEIKNRNINPDEIFMELHIFAGGCIRKNPKHEAAVLAVLAHLFEMCDIFENPPEERS